MKAVVFEGVGNIVFKDVAEPELQDPHDVIVKITTSAICGTDLHLIRGTMPMVKKGTVLGHEGIGVVEHIGKKVTTFCVGDRVIVPSTIACGHCAYCKEELYSQCDKTNPYGPQAGTAFYGGPISSGSFNGMQAEKVKVPFADVNLIKIPDYLSDEQVILISDILPTSYMAVQLAEVNEDDTVAVFGCGPVGQLAIACLKRLGVKKVFAIDHIQSRLKMAHDQATHIINFDKTDPVKELQCLTNKRGPTKIIDAVGIDAESPKLNFLKKLFTKNKFKDEVKNVAPITNPHHGNWIPGNAPSQVLQWAIEAIAKNGTFSIIGVYTPLLNTFPIGKAMGKNLTIKMGNCNHRQYIPLLLEWVEKDIIDLRTFITHKIPFYDVITAYQHFDKRDEDWIKVILEM